MKRKNKKELPKPRNEFVIPMRNRKSGAHGKSKKAVRQQEKMQLKQEVSGGGAVWSNSLINNDLLMIDV